MELPRKPTRAMPRRRTHQPCAEQTRLPLGDLVGSESDLVSVALALGARSVAGWSSDEEELALGVEPASERITDQFREKIRAGEDPLGALFCGFRSPARRRQQGATFTPAAIVDAMVQWAIDSGTPHRVVDPGAGSARYLLTLGKRLQGAELIGIEIDPLPALLARANLAAGGLANRAQIIVGDYRDVSLAKIGGTTLFIGNPPYVRHHDVGPQWKRWLVAEAAKRNVAASQLAGLHLHFFLATANLAQPGDYGAFITAAEWLDVNYGKLLRELLLRELGGRRVVVIEPAAMPFADAATTAAITYFKIGAAPSSMRFKRVDRLERLGETGGNRVVAASGSPASVAGRTSRGRRGRVRQAISSWANSAAYIAARSPGRTASGSPERTAKTCPTACCFPP